MTRQQEVPPPHLCERPAVAQPPQRYTCPNPKCRQTWELTRLSGWIRVGKAA